MKKALISIGSSLTTFFVIFSVVGLFIGLVRKVSPLLKVIK